MPRIPDYDKKHKHNNEYIFIDTTSDYKINLLDAKLEEHEKHPFKNAETVDEVSENDYTIMEGEGNTPKKVLASAFINSVIDDSEVVDTIKEDIIDIKDSIDNITEEIAALRMDGGEIL